MTERVSKGGIQGMMTQEDLFHRAETGTGLRDTSLKLTLTYDDFNIDTHLHTHWVHTFTYNATV